MKRDRNSIIYLAIIVFVIIFVCYYVYLAEINRIIEYSVGLGQEKLATAGTLGDTAGLINALFSGLAFGGVILTIIWQIQNDKRGRQSGLKVQFENTFFNMTQTFEKIIEGLSIENKSNKHEIDSHDFLSNIYEDKHNTKSTSVSLQEPTSIKDRALFKYLYEERKVDGKQLVESIRESGITAFENVMDGILDHYFRYFYRILKFIDDTELIDSQQKYYYASIFRAQLSRYELLMIYYNGLSKFGREKLKPLLEKYCVFKNLAEIPELMINLDDKEGKSLIQGYDDSAMNHRLIYDGNSISIVINSVGYSIVLIMLLALSASCLDNFIFKDIFALPVLRDSSGKIICLMFAFMILYAMQAFFIFRGIDVKNVAYTSKWDKFRYILSNYYNANNLQLVIPIVVALSYLCGMHAWYGYGFILYVNLIMVWLFIKPVIAVGFTAYKIYQFK